ncbi:MAG: aminotransferase class IV [Deltaproteobacteria bacterium]|nr:aminotransferase class IV [Deltaproteobacteria bacterium]
MPTLVSLDGRSVAPEAAVISVFDRGFLYGDSVYEVIRAYRGVPFELTHHLDRLRGSAERIGMSLPVALETLADETRRAIQESGEPEAYVRVVVTRGAGAIGLDVALAEAPRRLVFVEPVSKKRPPAELYEHGAKLAIVGVVRNLREAVDPAAKTGNYLNSVLALAEAKRAGAHEALMLDHRGLVTEGASSNVFVVFGAMLLTPPLDVGILAGVTRHVVLELAKDGGLRALELPLTRKVILEADECFITSTIREIVPVVEVDGMRVGEGKPGRSTRRLIELFKGRVERQIDASVQDAAGARGA